MLSTARHDSALYRGNYHQGYGHPPEDNPEEEVWHALLGPGDVRALTLDQLDAAFKVELVSEETYVWQNGMAEWRTLASVLAEHPEPAEEETYHVLMPDRSIREFNLDLLDALYQDDVLDENSYVWREGMAGWSRLSELFVESSAPPLAAPTVAQDYDTVRYHERPTMRDLQTVEAPAAAKPVVATVQVGATASRPAPSTAPASAAVAAVKPPPSSVVALSAPPVALSLPAAPEVQRGSSAGKWLLRVSVGVAAMLALARNDAFLQVAMAVNGSQTFLQAERALGGPGFGTPRAVEALVKSCGGPLEPVEVPVVVAQRLQAPTERVQSGAPSSVPGQRPNSAGAAAESRTSVPSEPPRSRQSEELAAALSGKAAAAKPATVYRAAPARKAVRKSGKVKGSDNYYDPLNGAL